VADVFTALSEKLIRRHPHVFGEIKVKDSAEVLDNWAKIKVEQEGRTPKDSGLDEVSRSLPPLDRAYKLQKKAAKAGFDWTQTKDVIAKINEELGEVSAAIAALEASAGEDRKEDLDSQAALAASTTHSLQNKTEDLEGELGDLLFSGVNLCRFLKVEPSVALQRTNIKFVRRFKYVEKKMKAANVDMKAETLETMEKFWQEAKENELSTDGHR
jgi:tetrapyrrole methylase family protein/MazG family protein